MKKSIANKALFMMLLFITAGCTACNKGDSIKEEKMTQRDVTEESKKESPSDIMVQELSQEEKDEQIKLIASKEDDWRFIDKENSGTADVTYAVTDMDQNGRLEIVAAFVEGSGRFTTSIIYEVSEDKKSLEKIWEVRNNPDYYDEIMPDICGVEKFPVFYDGKKGENKIIVTDYIKASVQCNKEYKYAWSLKQGNFESEVIASGEYIYDEGSSAPHFEGDGINGDKLDLEAYHSYEDIVYKDFEKKEMYLSWITVEKLNANDDIVQLLENSYERFSIV